LTVLNTKYMENISKKVNLRTRVDAAMFVITINRVKSIGHYTWGFFNGDRRIKFSSDIRKRIENKLEK